LRFLVLTLELADFKFVTTDGQERPLPENSTPIEEGDDEGRGSLVYFNQASMYRCSEQDAEDAPLHADYSGSVQEAFLTVGKRISVLAP
jgi:hypothetical protein